MNKTPVTEQEIKEIFHSFLRSRISAGGWEGYAYTEFWKYRSACNEFLEEHGYKASWAYFEQTLWGNGGWGYKDKMACYLRVVPAHSHCETK